MRGWLVNDRLTAIPGTRTLWHHLLDAVHGLEDRTTGQYGGLAHVTNMNAFAERPDYIIRNAAYFQRLEVECPVIAFVQDILQGFQRELLIDACTASRLVVFNSEYTRSAYPELHSVNYRVIPVGTDETVFAPVDGLSEHAGSVLWVGSGHPVKGFDTALALASGSKRPWVFVMKDDAEVPGHTVYRRITQERLAFLASVCEVGVCTSREETQHLAGIEMGMCGLPLVTTEVGVYHGRDDGAWGRVHRGDWHSEIEAVAGNDRAAVAAYWRSEGFGLDNCMSMWRSAIESLEAVHVNG